MAIKTERIDRAVYLKSGSYWVVKRNKWTGPYPTVEVAQLERDRIETEQAPKPAGGPFADFVRQYYYPHYLSKMKTNTQLIYKRIIESSIIPFFASKKIGEITNLDVNEFQESLRKKGLQGTTVNGRINILQMIFKAAIELGFIGRSPVQGLKNLREIVKDRIVLTEKEIIELVEKIEHPYRYGVALAGLAGARVGEVMGFKWEDFDLSERGKITFKRQINEAGEIDELKSKTSAVTLPMIRDLVRLLLEFKKENFDSEWLFQGKFCDYMAKVQKTKEGLRCRYHTKPKLQKHTLRSGNSMSGWWRKNRMFCDLQTMRFHDFRHSFATNVVTHCANIKTAQKLCRHANINTTLEIYAHVHPEQLEEVWNWEF